MQTNPLPLLTAIPIFTGILCLLLKDDLKWLVKLTALAVTAACLGGSIFVFMKKPLSWQAYSYNIFTVDNLSAFIALGIAVFAFLITIYSFGFIKNDFGKYFGYSLITLGASLGAAFANNLIVLLVFWGMLAVLLYLLVNMESTDRAAASAKKAFIIIGSTDAVMMLGIGLIWAISGTLSMDKIHLSLQGAPAYFIYFSFAIAAFAKAGVMPFHSWVPDVAQDGPTPVTAYLPASLDKLLGIYLLARISLNLFVMNAFSNFVLLLAGSVTIILAVVFALVQHDLKRLLGYHAVSQVGYMVLGIGTGNAVGIAGALFHMLNNAIYKSCLFLSGGNVEKNTGTTDLGKLGGLAVYMPLTFSAFLIASLSISGIPPFNGFVSKWMIFQGIIQTAKAKDATWILWLTAAMFGSALTIASFMKLIHAIFLGRPESNFKDVKEVGFSMWLPVAVLAALCVIFGIFAFTLPLPLFINPALSLGPVYIGTWTPVIATALIVIGIIAGLLIYLLSRPKTFRTVHAFIGGEDVRSMERISGTEFYNTIKDVGALGALYKKEENGSLDIYEGASRVTFFFSRMLQRLHNGVLPTYLVWCLIGLMVLFFVIMR